MIVKLAEGLSRQQVARDFRCAPATVVRVWKRYVVGGEGALLDQRAGNGSPRAARRPQLPEVRPRWGRSNALFKPEGDQVNIGLGRGAALDIFNDSIRGFETIGAIR